MMMSWSKNQASFLTKKSKVKLSVRLRNIARENVAGKLRLQEEDIAEMDMPAL